MIWDPRLPNDLLHNAPWPETIPTWPINDAFLEVIKKAEEALDNLGYYLKFGIETNLNVLSPSEALKLQARQRDPSLLWRQACRESFIHEVARVKDRGFDVNSYAEFYATLEGIASQRQAQQKRHPTPEGEAWLRNWRLTQSFYRRAGAERETVSVDLARKNFMIAALHLLPQSMGGLHGLIEQRFASAHYGRGWWDGKNSIELRTLPKQGCESAIASYHHILWQLKKAVEYFDFVPLVLNALGQVHFSLWRKEDNCNIMASKDDESLSLQTKFAESLQSFLISDPVNYPTVAFRERMFESDIPFVGSSRASVIRICNGHWELRLPHKGGVTHLARDIYLIASAAKLFAKPSEEIEITPEQEDEIQELEDELVRRRLVYLPIGDMLDTDREKNQPIRRVKKMTITADPPRTACFFVSSLEAAVINDQGEIDVPLRTLQINAHSMLKILGEHAANLFSVYYDEVGIANLEDALGWQELFKKLKIADDGTIDASAIHPLIAIHFEGLNVSGYRMDIHGGEPNRSQVMSRDRANFIAASWIGAGRMNLFHEKEAPEAQKEIHRFFSNHRFMFDSQEAVRYLLGLYNEVGAYAAKDAQTQQKIIEMAAQHMLYIFLGDSLDDRRKYPKFLASNVDCYADHKILRLMQSMRENLLQAIPQASQYDSTRMDWFFSGIKEYLCSPEKLYAPENIVWLLRAISGVMEPFLDYSFNDKSATDSELRARREFAFDMIESLGRTSLRIVAAAQTDDRQTVNILEQYAAQAETFTLYPPNARAAGKKFDEHENLLRTSIREEAEQLLMDRSHITQMRQQTIEDLQAK